MKTIDEIEKLSIEDLERISLDESTEVPAGLENRIGQALYARSRKRMIPWICGIAASLLLVVGLAISLRPPQLQDTFDDPALAYAEVERALLSVSGTINEQLNNALTK